MDLLVMLAERCPLSSARAFALSFKRASIAVRDVLRRKNEMLSELVSIPLDDLRLVQRRISMEVYKRKRDAISAIESDMKRMIESSRSYGNTCVWRGCTAPSAWGPGQLERLCYMHCNELRCSGCSGVHGFGDKRARCGVCGKPTPSSCGVYHMDKSEVGRTICRGCLEDLCD